MAPIQSYLDYTLLRPGATVREVEQLCDEALAHGVCAVCVPPCYLGLALERLSGADVKACTVIGFPHGMHLTSIKVTEARTLLDIGADELDMVMNLGRFRSGDPRSTKAEIDAFVQECQRADATSKLIIESGLLTFEEVAQICEICTESGVDFVKTSTGFTGAGAELDKVRYMREILPEYIQIKASGGIKTVDQAKAFIEAGASRIGASSLLTE